MRCVFVLSVRYAHCITPDTQVFVYNFIFHVFFVHSLSLSPLFNFTPPRYVCVCSTLCAYTLWEEKTSNNNNINSSRMKSYCAHRCTDCETNIMIFVERCYKKNTENTNIENQNEIVFISSLLRLPTTKTHIGFFSCSANSKWNWNKQRIKQKQQQKYYSVYYLSGSYNFRTHPYTRARPKKKWREKRQFSFCGNFLPLVFTSN